MRIQFGSTLPQVAVVKQGQSLQFSSKHTVGDSVYFSGWSSRNQENQVNQDNGKVDNGRVDNGRGKKDIPPREKKKIRWVRSLDQTDPTQKALEDWQNE